MLSKVAECPNCENGNVYFLTMIIESPIKTVAHLCTTDIVCDKCTFSQKNIFKQKFDFTNEQIRVLLLDFGDCTISEFEEKYPCNSADVFMDLCCEQELKKRGKNQ